MRVINKFLKIAILISLTFLNNLYSQSPKDSNGNATKETKSPRKVEPSEEKADKLWKEFEEFNEIRKQNKTPEIPYTETKVPSNEKQDFKTPPIGIHLLSDTDIQRLKDILRERTNDVKIIKNLAIIYLYKGYEGDKNAMNIAQEYFQKMIEINNNDNVAKAYYGATLITQGIFAWLPWEKLSTVEKGITEIDLAALKDPTNLEIRYIRGSLYSHLPELIYKKRFYAISDLEFINKNFNEKKDTIYKWHYLNSHVILAKLYIEEKKHKEAEKLLQKAIELAPESPQAIEAKDMLKRYF